MLYTILPPETVWEGQACRRNWRETSYQGIPMIIEEMAGGSVRLERLLSTDPLDYLNPKLQPGFRLGL